MTITPFPGVLERRLAIVTGIFCLGLTVYFLRKQSIWWRLPINSEIKRNENPILYWIGVVFAFLLGVIAILAGLFDVQRIRF